ncbi:MAG: hypothetical protein AMXMBFR64_49640 [Myxococcales bacterium]
MMERPQAEIEPRDLKWLEDGSKVGITWRDGHESVYGLPYLRRICPCAVCRGSHDAPPLSQPPAKRFNILTDKQVAMATPAPAKVKAVAPVGSYAIAFTWVDGHDEGIYSFRYLRDMCPCEACGDQVADDGDQRS